MSEKRIHKPAACDQALELTTCAGCARLILWARDEKGDAIPLDASAPVYRVMQATTGTDEVVREVHVGRVRGLAVEMSFVTHFSTCPKAAEFTGGKRKK